MVTVLELIVVGVIGFWWSAWWLLCRRYDREQARKAADRDRA